MFFQSYECAATVADPIATTEAIRCLLTYTHGLEDCLIDVEMVDGTIMLTGTASSEEAASTATSIAADFTSKPVLCSLQVAGTSKFA
ncbi:BON domain-containing protein [Rhizobium sp. S163]|uniref:BON domain-containing protein n=1 Tax=Rhizobium sp. S163 TaxID=3055039 RepID=UPI0025A96373|nr:BON domain-containing protein [Rhizobium sp. S163]MDM9646836.1 BON domain-containing protein [Rhizobium sp. S163]